MSVEFVRLSRTKSTRRRPAATAWAAAGAAAAIAPAALRALPTTRNYRGAQTPFPAGVIPAVMATITTPDRRPLNAGVAVLGLIDDLGGDGAPRGLRAHARARTLTTGHLKAIGTATLAAATTRNVRETATIILATHVFNVLDTGAALLGAIAARHLPATAKTIAVLTAIALVAELTSLTALIDRVPPLRALDWLGRRNSIA